MTLPPFIPLPPPKRLLDRVLGALTYPERAAHRTVLASVVGVVALSTLISIVLMWLLRPAGGMHSVAGFLIAALPTEATLFALAGLSWLRRARRPMPPPLQEWPWPRLGTFALLGLATGPLLFLVGAMVQVAMALAFGVRQTQLAEYLWIQELAPLQFLVLLFVGAILAPLAEECFFRGFVFRAYLRALGPLWAYLISAAIFGLIHLNLPAAPPIFAMGLLLGWLYHRSGSLLPSIVAHGFNNAATFLLLYLVPTSV